MTPRRTVGVTHTRTAPVDYFAPGAWPDAPPVHDAPETVLYVAELSRFLRATATKDGLTLANGLAVIASKTGVPAGTLRHIIDGDRWPSIEVAAKVELAYRQDIVGYSALLRRRDQLAHQGAGL
jgi:hypothetical protein